MNYRLYQVTLMFGGDDCPQLVDRCFTVTATGVESAFAVAVYDAIDLGYKRNWVIGHTVELL